MDIKENEYIISDKEFYEKKEEMDVKEKEYILSDKKIFYENEKEIIIREEEDYKEKEYIISDKETYYESETENVEIFGLTTFNISQNYFNESIIIQKNEEKQNLISWISEKGKIKCIYLLYRATRDGDTYNSRYNKCSYKGQTVSIIYIKNGRRFGGFSFANWTDQE